MSELYEDTVTYLSPEEENKFLSWVGDMRLSGKIHPEDDFSDYDMRGYWKETGGVGDADYMTHFPDKWKRPNHPTFSDESIYSQGEYEEKYGPMAGHWDGDTFVSAQEEASLYNSYQNEKDAEYDFLSQKESLENLYGVQIDIPTEDITNPISSKSGVFSGQTIEEVANKKETSPVNIQNMIDVMDDFANGVYEFFRATQEIGAWGGGKVAELVAGKEINFDPDKDMSGFMFNQGESPEPKSLAGGIAKTVGQIAPGIGATSLLTKMTGAKGLTSLAKTPFGQKLLGGLLNVFKGMAVDSMSFSANSMNFAEMLKALGFPTIETLVKNPNDSFMEKKIKNSVDGGIVGTVINAVYGLANVFWTSLSYPVRLGLDQMGVGLGVGKALEGSTEAAGINLKDTLKIGE